MYAIRHLPTHQSTQIQFLFSYNVTYTLDETETMLGRWIVLLSCNKRHSTVQETIKIAF